MAKLILQPEPIFKAPVPVPVPGDEPIEVVFHFRHKSREELKTFTESLKGKSDVEAMLEVCCGWDDIDDEFGEDALKVFDQNWHGGAKAVFNTYLNELRGIRSKN